MTNQISDEEYLTLHPEHSNLDPNIRAQMRQNTSLQAEVETERAARISLERRVAFAEAGLPDHPARELIEKTYEGEMTADAIREYAAKYGVSADTATAPVLDNRADLDALRRSQQAGTSAAPTTTMDFGDALSRARSPEEWNAIMQQAPPEAGVKLKATTKEGHRII